MVRFFSHHFINRWMLGLNEKNSRNTNISSKNRIVNFKGFNLQDCGGFNREKKFLMFLHTLYDVKSSSKKNSLSKLESLRFKISPSELYMRPSYMIFFLLSCISLNYRQFSHNCHNYALHRRILWNEFPQSWSRLWYQKLRSRIGNDILCPVVEKSRLLLSL